MLAAVRRFAARVPLAKRSLEQATDMTDASVEHGDRRRCNKHPTVPESADSSITESSTDTGMESVAVRTILSEIPETEGCPTKWTSTVRVDDVGFHQS